MLLQQKKVAGKARTGMPLFIIFEGKSKYAPHTISLSAKIYQFLIPYLYQQKSTSSLLCFLSGKARTGMPLFIIFEGKSKYAPHTISLSAGSRSS